MEQSTAPASAPSFELNSFYDRLISIRRTDRKTFDSFSIPTRLALTEYEKRKREFEQLTEGATRNDRNVLIGE
jgi:hypothetical protein